MEDTARSEKGILDRPLFSGGKISWWHVAYVGIILFVLFTRFWDLGSRGYSHDESIHAWESWKLITGQGYRHNPVYHGPFLYHFTALLFALFGDTDFTARLGAALFGVALTVMPLFFRRWLGTKGVIATTLFMAISPVMMDRSRFLRHDPFVALFNLMLFLGIMRYLAERKTRDLYLVAAALALGLTAKETTFITYFIFGTFLFLFWGVHWVRDRRLTWRQMTTLPVFDLMVAMGTLILPFASAFPIALLGQDPIDYNTGLWLKGLVFSQQVLMKLASLGLKRQEAYEMVQRNALQVWETGKAFKTLLLEDETLRTYLSEEDIEEIFSLNYHLKYVDAIFQRVFG